MQQFILNHVDSVNGGAPAPTISQPLHEMARGTTKHYLMHPDLTTDQFIGQMPDGWTLATRLSMMGIQSNPTQFSEVLVTIPQTGNATTDAQAAVNAAVQKASAAEFQTMVAFGGGGYQSPDLGSLTVSILYQHQ